MAYLSQKCFYKSFDFYLALELSEGIFVILRCIMPKKLPILLRPEKGI